MKFRQKVQHISKYEDLKECSRNCISKCPVACYGDQNNPLHPKTAAIPQGLIDPPHVRINMIRAKEKTEFPLPSL